MLTDSLRAFLDGMTIATAIGCLTMTGIFWWQVQRLRRLNALLQHLAVSSFVTHWPQAFLWARTIRHPVQITIYPPEIRKLDEPP
jgi:hypothetical protein